MTCTHCNSANPDGAKFCAECGTPMPKQCPKCSTPIAANAKFCHECGASVSTAAPKAAAPVVKPVQPISRRLATDAGALAQSMAAAAPADVSSAERRQLTVIFSDLVSFTTLSQQLDPEDLNTVVHEYYAVCRAVCQRYEGHIANYLGDGVLMMFGYPKAHEDDAHRAVRTGLAILEGMAALNVRLEHDMGLKLSVRVGIHTGLMIVGDDRAGNWQQMALGETLNIAARVQAVGREDSVVISSVTKSLVEGFFAMRSIGAHSLKGVAQPMEIFAVTHESTARGRLEAAGRATLTPLTGRDEEVARLLREWDEASMGKGRAVLITGEGGIGKSRLVQMLKEHVANLPNVWLTPCQCSPYHQNTSMFPYIDLIERVVLKLDRHESVRERLKKLEGMIVQYGFDSRQSLPVFGTFHSLPPEAGYEPSSMDPAQQRRHYMDAMKRITGERSQKQPTLFVMEDLHWVDPTTLETLRELIQTIAGNKLLFIFTARPEFVSPWIDDPAVHHIDLKRLESAQARIICQRVARGKKLPEEVIDQIIERADGVPLFVEELTKMIIGSGLMEERGDSYRLIGPLPALAIPSTLQDSLMARLDRLSSVKEIAQIAAVIGREFTYELIRYVYPVEDAFMRHALTQLLDEEIIDEPSGSKDQRYTFKHALVQEAAYQSLVKSRRQHYHRLIAHALEEHFPEITANEPELLAHHYTEAVLGWQAIPYLRKAGDKAAQRSAHKEAIVHFTRALELVRSVSDSGNQRWEYEIHLLIGLGVSLTATKGYGVEEVQRTYARARDLCEQYGTPGQLFQSRYGLWRLHMLRAEYETATQEGEQLLLSAKKQNNEAFLIAAHRAVGATLFYRGQFEQSLGHVKTVIEMTASMGDDDTLIRDIYDVVDPRVTCRSYVAWNLWMLGYPDRARQEATLAISLAERLKHPFSIALATSFAIWLKQFCELVPRVRELATRSLEYSKQHGFPFWIGWDQVLIGWADSHDEARRTTCIENMHKGLANWKEQGSNLGCGYFFCLVADAHLRFGQGAEARDALAQAKAFMQETGERYWEAERLRLNGELALRMQDNPAQAILWFEQALELARQQKALSMELRAATSMAKCLQSQGKTAEARAALVPVFEKYDEGLDLEDYATASKLLATL
jgi:class 3 adenylate cyclase/predicted ATPase